jgi:hypothetical protein
LKVFHLKLCFFKIDIRRNLCLLGDIATTDKLGHFLNDVGSSHSPLYGLALYAYPVYGPYQATAVLA